MQEKHFSYSQKHKIIRWLFVLCFYACNLYGQEKLVTLKFYGDDNGLKAENINSFAQDADGFIWLGSIDGLIKFDGRTFTTYRKGINSICGNSVKALCYTQNKLWVATNEGLCYLQNNHFVKIETNSKINFNALNVMSASADGTLFFGIDKDNIYQLTANDKTHLFKSVSVPNKTTYAILPLDKNHIITGHIYTSLIAYSNSFQVTNKSYLSKENNTKAFTISAIARDAENQYWCGAWDNALHCFGNNLTLKASYIFNGMDAINSQSDEITCIAFINDSCLWFGTKSSGLFEFNIHSKTMLRIQTQHEIPQRINTLYVDKQKRVWIGTQIGIALYDPMQAKLNLVKLPEYEGKKLNANCFIRYNDTTLLIGTQEGIVVKTPLQRYLQPIYHNKKKQAVHVMSFDIKHRLVIGTNQTFLRMAQWMQFDTLQKSNPDYLQQMISTRATTIDNVAGSYPITISNFYGHFLVLINSNFEAIYLIVKEGPLVENLINKILVDNENRVWCAGASHGLLQLNTISKFEIESQNITTARLLDTALITNLNSSFITGNNNSILFTSPKKFDLHDADLQYSALDIVQLNDTQFYVSTAGNGIYEFNPKATQPFKSIASEQKTFKGLLLDANKNLWAVSGNSLVRYHTKQKTWMHITTYDGLPSSGLNGNVYKDQNNFYAGGLGYYVKFNPLTSDGYNIKHPIFITSLTLNNINADSLLHQPSASISQTYNNIQFQFSYLDFTNPQAINYRYKLEGLHPDWIDAGNENSVVFSNLSSGYYTLHITAFYKDTETQLAQTSYTFYIKPFWYKTWWFFTLLVAFIFLAVYAFYMYRLRQLHKFYNMRNNIARDLHDDVGSALSSILIGSQLIKRITPDDDDQKHHIIDSINKASSQTISNMSDIVWSLNPANDTGEKILNKMREVAFQLLEQQNIRVLFNCDTSFDLLLLNMDVRRNIFLIFKESIHNIAKYAQAKNVTISLIIKNQDLNICISDDGVGFILSDKTVGNGLQNMQIRANQMQAQFQVLSDIGKGTTIILHAPITKIR